MYVRDINILGSSIHPNLCAWISEATSLKRLNISGKSDKTDLGLFTTQDYQRPRAEGLSGLVHPTFHSRTPNIKNAHNPIIAVTGAEILWTTTSKSAHVTTTL